jgi:hypothetical protein
MARFLPWRYSPMENDTLLPASPKKPLPGKVIVVSLLGIQGIFLIVIGLIAFFGGFVGVYNVSHGHATPGAIVAVLGAALAWIFLLGGIVSLLCAQGLLTWQRWALWLTIVLEVINLIVGGCALCMSNTVCSMSCTASSVAQSEGARCWLGRCSGTCTRRSCWLIWNQHKRSPLSPTTCGKVRSRGGSP